MKWHTVEVEPGTLFIQDGDRIVGSINLKVDQWHVEILWSGPSGDITFRAKDYISTLAFIQGVEQAFIAFKAATQPT